MKINFIGKSIEINQNDSRISHHKPIPSALNFKMFIFNEQSPTACTTSKIRLTTLQGWILLPGAWQFDNNQTTNRAEKIINNFEVHISFDAYSHLGLPSTIPAKTASLYCKPFHILQSLRMRET